MNLRLKRSDFIKAGNISPLTLSRYKKLGLLIPFINEETHDEFYTAEDLARLQMIVSLRYLGLSLPEVQEALKDQKHNLLDILPKHIAKLKKENVKKKLCANLEHLLKRLHDQNQNAISPEEFIAILKLTLQ